jgi:hypothetical protein
MNDKKKHIIEIVVKVIVAALTAFITAITTTSCMGHGPFYLKASGGDALTPFPVGLPHRGSRTKT